MRDVFTNPTEAKEKGRKARAHVTSKFSAEVVSEIYLSHFERLKKSYSNSFYSNQ